MPVRCAPDLELLDGRGAKRIGGAQQHRSLLVLEAVGQLADGGGLAGSVHADHQDHGRRFDHPRRRPLAGFQDLQQVLTDEALQFGGVAQLVTLHALADALQNLLGGAHADISRDQRGFELVQQFGIDLFLALQRVFESIDQPGARLLHAALQSFEERWLLLDRAEKSLNHC